MKIFLIITLPLLLFANECLNCHKIDLKTHAPMHYSLNKEISLTLKAWGLKEYNYTLENLPEIKDSNTLNSKSKLNRNLAIDFLRRKCLQCHLNSKRVNPSGNSCLACHNPHSNKNDDIKAKATEQKCLKCHNGNFIGTDYLGLFPKDFDESYRAPIQSDGSYPKRLGGIDYHHLIEDIHSKKGLTCISCHNNKNGNFEKVSCISCHQNISSKNHPKYHSKISCIACHSAWQTNSYKSIILRSDMPNYKDFKRLTLSQDPYLENFLQKALKNSKIAPAMPDFLTNKIYKGLWYLGYEFRRWENFYLINYRDKIELARPLLDFELTYVDDKNRTIIDAKKFGGFVVTKPHTIIKEAKSCENCHNNRLNLSDKSLINYKLLKGNLLEGSNLTKEQIEHLKSTKYKLLRAKELFKR